MKDDQFDKFNLEQSDYNDLIVESLEIMSNTLDIIETTLETKFYENANNKLNAIQDYIEINKELVENKLTDIVYNKN